MANTQLNLLYTMHGDELSDNSSMNSKVHRSVIMPVLKELKGYLRVYMWDCSHPKIKKGELEWSQKHVCDVERNPQKMPSLMLLRQPETRINPYTG